MGRKGWVNMEFPYHQNQALKLLKRRWRKRNMAEVMERMLEDVAPDILESGIQMAKVANLYQPIVINNNAENDDDDEELENVNHG